MIVFGRRNIRIKKYDDYTITCKNCGERTQQFSVFQQYFHVFFIPIFPTSIKSISCACLKCNDRLNQEKRNYYLSITKTPMFLYTGVILFFGLIAFILIGGAIDRKKEREYVLAPETGDVYLIKEDNKGESVYYFFKIRAVDFDTIYLVHSAYQYDGYVSTLNDSDYFVKDDVYSFLNQDLKNMQDSGLVISVERDYPVDSRFSVDK